LLTDTQRQTRADIQTERRSHKPSNKHWRGTHRDRHGRIHRQKGDLISLLTSIGEGHTETDTDGYRQQRDLINLLTNIGRGHKEADMDGYRQQGDFISLLTNMDGDT
jgi:hypothetical protein